jgi:D-sedoheptulose 7-phosphate isomerase
MSNRIKELLEELVSRYPILAVCKEEINYVYNALADCFEAGGRLYICGNGGSAADALHIVGELMKSFVQQRSLDKQFNYNIRKLFPFEAENIIANLQGALPAYQLVENTAFSTAYANDLDDSYIFAQQVYGYVRQRDVVLGISTSGNSKNVVMALAVAKALDAKTIGLTGQSGGELLTICDHCICVPEVETYKIQELHLPVYHTLCLMLEEYFFNEVV